MWASWFSAGVQELEDKLPIWFIRCHLYLPQKSSAVGRRQSCRQWGLGSVPWYHQTQGVWCLLEHLPHGYSVSQSKASSFKKATPFPLTRGPRLAKVIGTGNIYSLEEKLFPLMTGRWSCICYTKSLTVPQQYIWNYLFLNTFTWRPILMRSEAEESRPAALVFRLTPGRSECGAQACLSGTHCVHVSMSSLKLTCTDTHVSAFKEISHQVAPSGSIENRTFPQKSKVFRNAALGLLCPTRARTGTCFQHSHSG